MGECGSQFHLLLCVWPQFYVGQLLHRELGTPIILGHHVLSLVGFPYATLRHLCVPFVQFFILTEVTGIPQHLRMMLLKLDREATLLYILVGVGWTVSFFLVRMLPIPWLAYTLVPYPCS